MMNLIIIIECKIRIMFVSIPVISSTPVEPIENIVQLSDEEKDCIRDYSDQLGNPLNENLMHDVVLTNGSRLFQCDRLLQSVFKKRRECDTWILRVTKTYRGYGNSDPFKNAKTGEIVSSKKYLSTTFSKFVAMDLFKGKKSFTLVFGRTGINITTLSKHKEYELLFEKNLYWRVLFSAKGLFKIKVEDQLLETKRIKIVEELSHEHNPNDHLIDTVVSKTSYVCNRRKSCNF